MNRLFFKVMIALLALFALFVTVIRAQPYNDHQLRGLLLPDDCQMPCFMGIHPGVTSAEDAFKLLEASQWVSAVEQDGPLSMSWAWSGSQPDFIEQSKAGYLILSPGKHYVSRIVLNISVMLGDVWLVLSAPTGHELGYMAKNPVVFYSLRYEDQQVLATGFSPACTTVLNFRNPITELEIGLARPVIEEQPTTLSDDLRGLKKRLC